MSYGQYLATMGLPPAASPFAVDDWRQAGYHYQYRAVCVTAPESPIQDVEDLRREAESRWIEFLFVHSHFASGRLTPEYALRKAGIRLDRSNVSYTHSHSSSLRLLTRPTGDRGRVAFVWDDALRGMIRRKWALRRIEFDELEELWIPPSVVVARSGFEHAGLIASLLDGYVDPEGDRHFKRFNG